ncbi:hypothetical protein HG535_0F03070 [Zygotorulaspora mrakii]|uniref:Maintenance of telomere capping protein 4 n=1 Tax=Zygotorulaspora mrakii TaxID=42260 RepID=A0A7H9B657_ZYGMR|nr:uncharacterized protein HG535_0F03070 [Zygotorulaspora mrakii]QLG73796.1 hypothetical protein HG535_0F03070 [Zygotorulaspora mrakii]
MIATDSTSDITANSDGKSDGESDDKPNFPEVKPSRIKFVTKILVDSKYGLMDDLNYTRGFPEHHDSTITEETAPAFKGKEYKKKTENPVPVIAFSRNARIKADRVRIYLDYYYSLLERYINIESPEHHHEGVEGVYNPLQIIRNRALRKKYSEQPPRELFIQRSPVIAIKHFSRKPKQKKPWYVTISERSSDLTWRTSHWDELVRPDGYIWFPKGSGSNSTSHKEPARHRRPRIGRMYSADSELSANSPYSAQGLTSSSPEIGKSVKGSPSHSSIPKHIERAMTRPENGDHKIVSEEIEKSRPNRFEQIIGKKSKRWSRSPHLRQKSQGSVDKLVLPLSTPGMSKYSSRTPTHSRRSSSSFIPTSHSAYMTPTEDFSTQRSTLLSALPIEHVRKRSIDQTEEEQIEDVQDLLGNGEFADSTDMLNEGFSMPQTDEQLENYWRSSKYILATLQTMQHRRITHNIVRKRGIAKRDKFQCDQNLDDIFFKTSEVLSTYDKELNKALKKGNSLASKMLNDYSMRVETLISTSDRILSDINTTLTLKLKLFQEDADKFGTLKGMQSQRFTRALYRILEYAIVSVLWSVWLVVSIIKWIKYSILLAFKIILWMLW